MKEIRLYGHLARRFGRRHTLDVSTPAEAVRALRANFADFEREIIRHPGAYRVVCGHERAGLAATALNDPTGADVIKIVPVIRGAGRGLGQVVLGGALMAFGYMTGGLGMSFSAAWAAGGTTFAGYVAGSIGFSLALGGVAQMLSPTVKTGGDTPERPENKPSYLFDGPVNTITQGNPVPILYGELWVGSQVISAGLSSEEYA